MNKKLFKGALVLFASILMAVSCSNKDNTGPNDPNNPNNPNNPPAGDKEIKVALVSGPKKVDAAKTTTLVVKEGENNQMSSTPADKTLEFLFSGEAAANLVYNKDEANKVKLVVKAINGLNTAGDNANANGTGTQQDMSSGKDFNTNILQNITSAKIEKDSDNYKLSIELANKFAATANLGSGEKGVIEIVFELTATGKDKKEIKAYFIYEGAA